MKSTLEVCKLTLRNLLGLQQEQADEEKRSKEKDSLSEGAIQEQEIVVVKNISGDISNANIYTSEAAVVEDDAYVPQVIVGENGQIVVNEASLVVSTGMTKHLKMLNDNKNAQHRWKITQLYMRMAVISPQPPIQKESLQAGGPRRTRTNFISRTTFDFVHCLRLVHFANTAQISL
jgi:hypothetical protein